MSDLDKADRILLDAVQENCRVGLEVLSEKSALSPPSVQRRLKRMRDQGIIEREIAVVNPKAVDFAMAFIVSVELEREAVHQLNSFKQKAANEPQVQQCYYVTGESDFILVCVAKNMEDFEALTQRLFFDDSNVRKFRTSVVMGEPKTGQVVPCL